MLVQAVASPPILERVLSAYARRFPIRKGKLRAINALWRFAAGSRGGHRMARLSHGGFRMRCDLNEMLQRQFYYFGTYFLEDKLLDCWAEAARDAAVVFDVGANTGIYSLAALAAQPGATVHAFEPTPEIAEALRATAELNELPRLQVHETAVSDGDGQLVLRRFRGETDDNGGMNFVVHADGGQPGERVGCKRLDSFCAEHGVARIDLMKLDVQGHEFAALSGAGRHLTDGRIGTLFMELNWAETADVSCPATAAIRLLEEAGYLFAEPGRRMQFRAAGAWLHGFSDIVARHGAAIGKMQSA